MSFAGSSDPFSIYSGKPSGISATGSEQQPHQSTNATNWDFGPSASSNAAPGMSAEQQNDVDFINVAFTPGATGMTPLPDSLWQGHGIVGGGDWMFTWNGDTGTPPQPR